MAGLIRRGTAAWALAGLLSTTAPPARAEGRPQGTFRCLDQATGTAASFARGTLAFDAGDDTVTVRSVRVLGCDEISCTYRAPQAGPWTLTRASDGSGRLAGPRANVSFEVCDGPVYAPEPVRGPGPTEGVVRPSRLQPAHGPRRNGARPAPGRP